LHLPPDSIEEVGGRVQIKSPNVRSLQNFAMQANSAEETRLAARMAYEANVRVLLTIHDAIAAEAPLEDLDRTKAILEECMIEASRIVLDGFALRVDTKIIRHPDRYMDKRGKKMWDHVMVLLDEIEGAKAAA
jgi:hypothetical protein